MNIALGGVNSFAHSSDLNLAKRSSTVLEKAKSSFQVCFVKDAGKACELTTNGARKSDELRGCDIVHHECLPQKLKRSI